MVYMTGSCNMNLCTRYEHGTVALLNIVPVGTIICGENTQDRCAISRYFIRQIPAQYLARQRILRQNILSIAPQDNVFMQFAPCHIAKCSPVTVRRPKELTGSSYSRFDRLLLVNKKVLALTDVRWRTFFDYGVSPPL
jgi:hypothetical protein